MPDPLRIISTEVLVFESADLADVIMDINRLKGTGSLTINYAGGKPSGTIEWKQKGHPK